MSRNEKAGDVAEYVFGVPLFAVVSILTGAVMAVGFVIIDGFDRLLHHSVQPDHRDRTREWTAAWTGAAGFSVANGVARDLLYKDRVGELAAQQLSTGTLIAALAGYSGALQRRWPIRSAGAAWRIGGIWLALTVLFEFVFGHYVARDSWADLARQYDLRRGRIWVLVPAAMALLPSLTRKLDRDR